MGGWLLRNVLPSGAQPICRPMAEHRSFDLHNTYVHLRSDDRSSTVAATPEFWPDVMAGRRKFDGRMLMAFRMFEDMTHWEMHPAGEELI